jgi:hypothetical protein
MKLDFTVVTRDVGLASRSILAIPNLHPSVEPNLCAVSLPMLEKKKPLRF